jgi:hypothetical protein
MLVRICRFIAIILSALVMGMALCHALELPAKMQYSASQYITIQNSLYVAFGPPNIGAYIEVFAPVTAIGLAILVRKRRLAFQLTLLAVALMLLAFPALFSVFIEPANVAFRSATPTSIPANWEQLRNQWEYAHLARFFCHLAGLSALVLSVLVETPLIYQPALVETDPSLLVDRSSVDRHGRLDGYAKQVSNYTKIAKCGDRSLLDLTTRLLAHTASRSIVTIHFEAALHTPHTSHL